MLYSYYGRSGPLCCTLAFESCILPQTNWIRKKDTEIYPQLLKSKVSPKYSTAHFTYIHTSFLHRVTASLSLVRGTLVRNLGEYLPTPILDEKPSHP